VKDLYLMGNYEPNLSRLNPDFRNPPSNEEFYALVPPAPPQQDVDAIRKLTDPMDHAMAAQDEER
jgi:hypothetical protein